MEAQLSEAELLASLDLSRLPRHVAVIMDGNGRWARSRGLPRIEGHRASMQSIREAVEACNNLGVRFLTLYAFSTENWSRPEDEVAALMVLIDHTLRAQAPELHQKNVSSSTSAGGKAFRRHCSRRSMTRSARPRTTRA